MRMGSIMLMSVGSMKKWVFWALGWPHKREQQPGKLLPFYLVILLVYVEFIKVETKFC